jgi:hypothetical protein
MKLGDDHGNAHGGEDHHVGLARIIVVRLLAVFEAADQRGQAEDAVDVEHHRRINRVAHESLRGSLPIMIARMTTSTSTAARVRIMVPWGRRLSASNSAW